MQTMWLVVRYWADLLRQPRSRAEGLLQLRRSLVESRALATLSEQELQQASELRKLRARIAGALGTPQVCTTCARAYPLPNGRWEGGYCCGTDTGKVFTKEEVWALSASGTTPASLVPPDCDHAGCLFRGPTGCTLLPEDRPNICLRYLCLDLVSELRKRGDLKTVSALCASLEAGFKRFVELHQERLEQEMLEQMRQELISSGPTRRT